MAYLLSIPTGNHLNRCIQLILGSTLAVPALFWMFTFLLDNLALRLQKRVEQQSLQKERAVRELHDSLLQDFQGIALQVQGITKKIPNEDPLRIRMEELLDRADDALSEARQRARDLSWPPGNDEELFDEIARCAKDYSKGRGASFNLAIVGKPRAIKSLVRDETCAIAREALRNAFIRSRASRIEVEITFAPTLLSVRVCDDGAGIEEKGVFADDAGYKVFIGMRHRALLINGDLMVWSRPYKGTELLLAVAAGIAYEHSSDLKI